MGLNRLLLSVLAGGGIAALGIVIYWHSRRVSPEERERLRRLRVNRFQRTVEGFLTEAGEDVIQFNYQVAGVDYYASQDVSSLHASLPDDPTRLIGPIRVKYDSANPANSIIVCEEWSGLPVPIDANKEQSTHGN